MMQLISEQGSGMKKKESFVCEAPNVQLGTLATLITVMDFSLDTSRTYSFKITKHLIHSSAYIEPL